MICNMYFHICCSRTALLSPNDTLHNTNTLHTTHVHHSYPNTRAEQLDLDLRHGARAVGKVHSHLLCRWVL